MAFPATCTKILASSIGLRNCLKESTRRIKRTSSLLGRAQERAICLSSTTLRYKVTGPYRPITSYVAQKADTYVQESTGHVGDASSEVKHICMLEEDRMIEATWADGQKTRYPYVWLRDNCQCPTCFHEFTNARLLLMRNLEVNVRPQSLVLDSENERVLIKWNDGHESPVPFGWLKKRSFKSEMHHKRDLMFRSKPILWGSELQNRLPEFEFDELLSSEEKVYEFLTRVEEYGVAMIRNAPEEQGQVEKLASKVSFMRMTPFGFVYTVKVRDDPPNLAWTSDPLGLHVDFTYLNYTPGVQLLHCIVQTQSTGGSSELVDAFHAAHQMKEEYPFYYKLLSEVPVDFTDVGSDIYPFHYLARHTTFTHNFDGDLEAVKYSNQTRDSYLRVPLELVTPFYKALRLLDDFLYRPENKVSFKLKPGDIVCFHNYRVLHGRTGFTLTPGGAGRHLEGCYLDWDDLHSRRRLLMKQLRLGDYNSSDETASEDD